MRTVVTNYLFNKTNKQITLTDYLNVDLKKLFIIVDVTNNLVIFQANDPNKGATVSGNVVTLTYNTNTSAFSNTDDLQIFYEEDVGQKIMSKSQSVVIASDQTAIAISDNGSSITVDGTISANQSGAWNIANISGNISLPTGASTSAKQDSQITELQAIKGHVDGVEATLSSIDGKVATEAKQDIGNASLSSIDGKVATEAKQDSQITELQAIKGHVDGVEGALSSIDGKVATESKQDTANTTLASIDTKVATTAKQDVGNSSLSSIDSKVATSAKQDTSNTWLASIDGKVATEATLIQVRDAIKAQLDIASTIWTDNSGSYYVRRDVVDQANASVSVNFVDPEGVAAVPGTGLRPLATADREVITDFYDVKTSAVNYVVGDLIARAAIIDPNGSTPSASFIWLNLTSGAVIAAPIVAHIERANEEVASRQAGAWNIVNITGTVSLPSGASTESKQDSQISELQAIKGHVDGVESTLSSIDGKVATEAKQDIGNASLSSIDGKVATASKQDSQISELQAIKGHVDGVESKLDTLINQTDAVEGTLSSIDSKVATEAKQDSQITELQAIKGHVDGVEGTLSSIDGKVATEAKQDSQITELQAIKGHVDAVETKLDTLINQTDGIEGTLSSIDLKVATEAKQDTGNTSLASIDGKVATEAKQDIGNASLSSIDGKVATEATVATLLTQSDFDQRIGEVQDTPTSNTVLGRLKDTKDTISARLGVLGQANMAGSTPVVIASNQTDVPVSQGSAASLAGAWPVKHTDGINTMPTADVSSRAIFAKVTDGVNTQPVGDVVERSVFNKISDGVVGPVSVKAASSAALAEDKSIVTAFSPNSPLPTGTNQIGKIEQGTAASLVGAWPVKHTDGINIMPTGDVNSRSIWMKIGDGTTGPVAVMGANASPTTASPSLVVQLSPNQDPIPTTVVPTDAFSGNSQGRTPPTGTNSFVPIRQTVYTAPSVAAQRSFVSSSANDSSAGTGARQVVIHYLDENGAGPSLNEPFYTETITLNGLTAVNTINTNICFIEKIEVASVGSGGSNAGIVTLFTGTGGTGTAIGSIGTGNIVAGQGDNVTLWAHHYVPLNYISDVYATVGGCVAAAGGGSYVQVLRTKNPTITTSPEVLVGDIITVSQGNAFLRSFGSPLAVFGPAILTLYGTPGANNTVMYGSFDFSDRPG